MLYQISHQTTYSYSQAVLLKPHLLRLYPRSNCFTRLHNFALSVEPQPEGKGDFVDLDGNNLIKLWFTKPTERLSIQVLSQVETTCTNPFNYLLESWAITLPFDYPSSLLKQLEPYLKPYGFILDATALELAQDILMTTQGNTVEFLFTLNQRIYKECEYITRERGEPFAAGITWRNKLGSCRDFTVLFMEVCRAVGIAARFVSGYQEGDRDQQNRDLHAWVEVYLPGAGWRGYDPTLGLVVSDRNIALAASAVPLYTSPVEGSVIPVKPGENVTSSMNAQISLTQL